MMLQGPILPNNKCLSTSAQIQTAAKNTRGERIAYTVYRCGRGRRTVNTSLGEEMKGEKIPRERRWTQALEVFNYIGND